ncbi:glycosyltransferase [Microbacterium lacus]|uniref:glycosyltransferase n=1 Tax=Microbacterium lacus TaxID=415217 RepID=UPI00385085C8
MSRSSITAVVVVVPVHDEQALLGRCLDSIAVAVAAVDLPTHVEVVMDACSDDSAVIAAGYPFAVSHIDAHLVGRARAHGVEAALAAHARVPERRVWIANTDADSVVPANWLTVQLELAKAGADVVIGTVRPEFDDLHPRHQQHWLSTHIPGQPNGHTHGANLGIRASAYRAVGGFAELPEHEDVGLVQACRHAGVAIAESDAAEVLTSGRTVGRTPGGYAGYLRAQAEMLGAKR